MATLTAQFNEDLRAHGASLENNLLRRRSLETDAHLPLEIYDRMPPEINEHLLLEINEHLPLEATAHISSPETIAHMPLETTAHMPLEANAHLSPPEAIAHTPLLANMLTHLMPLSSNTLTQCLAEDYSKQATRCILGQGDGPYCEDNNCHFKQYLVTQKNLYSSSESMTNPTANSLTIMH
mmetsp:Transcript_7991/g.18830  ORF Transcript_7991/g.18830 Transcript_7991/m.18830 type:complete len:181 (-) Transcript_7991:857-1399(-)